MYLQGSNIQEYPSIKHESWYSIQKLIDAFPNCRWFCVPTTLKGIGKSYSIWHERLIPDANNGLGAVIINWKDDELEAMIDELENNPEELTTHLHFEVEWHKSKGVTICRRIDTGEGVFYFVTPPKFSVLKGMTIKGNLPIRNVYWDEFLLPQGIYRKPKETLDGLWQLLGSIFRDNDFYIFMSANNTNPNNPFLWYLFNDMGWPDYDQTIVNHDAGVVIDSPAYNGFMEQKYKASTLWKLSKIKPEIHKQLFGGGRLNDSIYDNQDMIIYRLREKVYYQFNFKLGLLTFFVYSYQNENMDWLCYITTAKNQNIKEVMYSGDITTYLQTGISLIEEDKILSLKGFLNDNKIRFRDVNTMNIIIDWISNYKNINEPIDWTKGKE